jgi:hypothetical protein
MIDITIDMPGVGTREVRPGYETADLKMIPRRFNRDEMIHEIHPQDESNPF